LPNEAAIVKRSLTFDRRFVGVGHVLGLGVEARAVDAGVVDAVLFAAGDAQFDFERHSHLAHPLEIALADVDVLLDRLFRQVEHVRAVERLAVGLEVPFAGIEQAVDPGQQLLGRVVGVQDDRRAIQFGHQMDVLGAGDAAGDARALGGVVEALAGKELRTAVGELDDRRRIELGGGFHDGVDRAGVDDVDCRQGELPGLGQFEDGLQLVASGDAGFDLC
jgi:hypothetical protein